MERSAPQQRGVPGDGCLRRPRFLPPNPLAARCRAIPAAIAVLVLSTTSAAAGEAMDLARLEPRWVAVQVVTTNPGDPELRLSEIALAWYEAGPGKMQRTVRVPGSEVERSFFADRSPVARSFSDFVWVFDAATRQVVSASFSGLVDEPIRIGPVRVSARVSISVEMSTFATGGYRVPHELVGRTVIGYCPDPTKPGCTAVASSIFDLESGWVRANGAVYASWHSLKTLAYTPLGQARFRELAPGSAADEAFTESRLETHMRGETRMDATPVRGANEISRIPDGRGWRGRSHRQRKTDVVGAASALPHNTLGGPSRCC